MFDHLMMNHPERKKCRAVFSMIFLIYVALLINAFVFLQHNDAQLSSSVMSQVSLNFGQK